MRETWGGTGARGRDQIWGWSGMGMGMGEQPLDCARVSGSNPGGPFPRGLAPAPALSFAPSFWAAAPGLALRIRFRPGLGSAPGPRVPARSDPARPGGGAGFPCPAQDKGFPGSAQNLPRSGPAPRAPQDSRIPAWSELSKGSAGRWAGTRRGGTNRLVSPTPDQTPCLSSCSPSRTGVRLAGPASQGLGWMEEEGIRVPGTGSGLPSLCS